jgi:hypothetical protein
MIEADLNEFFLIYHALQINVDFAALYPGKETCLLGALDDLKMKFIKCPSSREYEQCTKWYVVKLILNYLFRLKMHLILFSLIINFLRFSE